MTTSSTRRVTGSFDTVEDATSYLRIEGGGKFDVSIAGISGSTIVAEIRVPPGGAARTLKSYTSDIEEMLEVASELDVRLRLTVDGGGTMTVELAVGQGKER